MMMYFSSVSDFMTMGGHGFYVWLAFGFSIFWLSFLLINPVLKKKSILKEVYAQFRIEEARNERMSESKK